MEATLSHPPAGAPPPHFHQVRKGQPPMPLPTEQQTPVNGLLMSGAGEPPEGSTATLVIQRIVSGEKYPEGDAHAPSEYASAEHSDSYQQRAMFAMHAAGPPSQVSHVAAAHSVQSIIRADETTKKTGPPTMESNPVQVQLYD